MDSASLRFIIFGLGVAVIANLSRSNQWRSAVLLVSSILFVGMLASSAMDVAPLAGFLALGYCCILAVRRGSTRAIPVSVILVIFAYVWLKKYTFLPGSTFLHAPYLTLGLSYIFFRVLHLIVEAGEAPEGSRINPMEYLLYNLNFLTFVSGPIQRYEDFSGGINAEKPLPLDAMIIGLELGRIIKGFFKVNVLATLLSAVQTDSTDQLFESAPLWLRSCAAIRLILVYPFFLYCNFSGYIDIVIGMARLIRIKLPENFDRPFSATSVIEFWTRWHMTLSGWLKVYVYNPLIISLMRRITSATAQPYLAVFSFFVTFFLIGVWHGRTSEFLFFGMLTGCGMSVNKLWQIWAANRWGRKRYLEVARRPTFRSLARGLTICWFAFTLLWFWSDWKGITRMASAFGYLYWMFIWVGAWILISGLLASWESLRAWSLSIRDPGGMPYVAGRYATVIYATTMGLVALALTVVLNQPAPGIVYKAF